MKHIVIDARLYAPKHTGIGRYTKNLLLALIKIPHFKSYKFTLLVYPELLDEIKKDLGNNYQYQTTNIRHYSLLEQFYLPIILYKSKPDLVHFTNFNKPILYFSKSVITIHDLIKHFSVGAETTTRHQLLYHFKHLGYLLTTFINIKYSQHLIVPSNFWQDFIIKKYHISSKKITTTYEAVDFHFSISENIIKKPENYIVYTGNLYPHKNIDIILQSLNNLPNIKLKIIGPENIFSNRLKTKIKKLKMENKVEFLGYLNDQEFKKIYQHALALVHPSLYEGFSLTGLEAMALNCPVIASNATCIPEIYGDAALYFDPKNSDQLISQITKLFSSTDLRQKLIKLGQNQIKKYSWDKTATQTFEIYRQLLS
jgi:glycosyltransferase involved in cell wall biosynthesis